MQERWLDRKVEWDEKERKEWEEAKVREEAGKNAPGASGGGGGDDIDRDDFDMTVPHSG